MTGGNIDPDTQNSLSPQSHIFTLQLPLHNEGLVNLSRRSRTLPTINSFTGSTPTYSLIARTEHGVFKRLDDGRELHEAGVHSLSPGLSPSTFPQHRNIRSTHLLRSPRSHIHGRSTPRYRLAFAVSSPPSTHDITHLSAPSPPFDIRLSA